MIIRILFTVCAFSLTMMGQETPRQGEKGSGRRNGGGGQPGAGREEMMHRFDTNGDGKIDEEERKAIRIAMVKRMNGDGADSGAGDMNQELVKKKLEEHKKFVMSFDEDKDGKLNPAERAAALEALKMKH